MRPLRSWCGRTRSWGCPPRAPSGRLHWSSGIPEGMAHVPDRQADVPYRDRGDDDIVEARATDGHGVGAEFAGSVLGLGDVHASRTVADQKPRILQSNAHPDFLILEFVSKND